MEEGRNESIDGSHKPSRDGSEDGQQNAARDIEKQNQLPVQGGRRQASKYEDPFGDEEGAEVKYKTMAWWQGSSERYVASMLCTRRELTI
jgi:hypothetical protein